MMPQETMTESFLPPMRGLLAHALDKRRLTQSRIASELSVTQAAVSQYLSKSFDYYSRKLEILGVDRSRLLHQVALIANLLQVDREEAMFALDSYWRRLMSSGELKHVHFSGVSVSGTCEICVKLLASTSLEPSKMDMLLELVDAVGILEASTKFYRVVPQVGSNLVGCPNRAEDESDVASIPGRIVRIGPRVRATSKPAFGASFHMAHVLLLARKVDKRVRAAINIRYDSRIQQILESCRVDSIRTDSTKASSAGAEDIVVERLALTLNRLRKAPDAVVDSGGGNMEPMTYLFGTTPSEAVRRALDIADVYSD